LKQDSCGYACDLSVNLVEIS